MLSSTWRKRGQTKRSKRSFSILPRCAMPLAIDSPSGEAISQRPTSSTSSWATCANYSPRPSLSSSSPATTSLSTSCPLLDQRAARSTSLWRRGRPCRTCRPTSVPTRNSSFCNCPSPTTRKRRTCDSKAESLVCQHTAASSLCLNSATTFVGTRSLQSAGRASLLVDLVALFHSIITLIRSLLGLRATNWRPVVSQKRRTSLDWWLQIVQSPSRWFCWVDFLSPSELKNIQIDSNWISIRKAGY